MRQASSTGPAAVSKYLLPREVQVATVRQHPAVLLAAGSQAVAGLLVAGLLSFTLFRHNHLLLAIVWIAWAVLLLRLIWKAINWAVDYFVITSQRVILTSGVLSREVALMPISKVTDMSFPRSFGGRILGYGELIVESAGQNQALDRVTYISYPAQLYLLVCGILFPAGADEEPSDEL